MSEAILLLSRFCPENGHGMSPIEMARHLEQTIEYMQLAMENEGIFHEEIFTKQHDTW